MKTYYNPSKSTQEDIILRPKMSFNDILPVVQKIFSNIKDNGDAALFEYIKVYDHYKSNVIRVNESEFKEAEALLSPKLKNAIQEAKSNITKFHKAQISREIKVDIADGITCWQRSVAIQSVGLYIPGGTAPLFSTVLMLAIPASLAGCDNIVLASPPDKNSGNIHPAILYAAKLCGVKVVYKMGGAQAIAAMALGTESVNKVFKIFGPGNQYVTAAKQFAFQLGTAVDMPAGPSEVLVFGDNSANPEYIAADLLSQAEHGLDSQVVLVTTHKEILKDTLEAIEKQSEALSRKSFVDASLKNSYGVYFENREDVMNFINNYAPEHLIIASESPEEYLPSIKNAGSVFVGNFSPESAGDYASGTNHTLPTAMAAKAFSGVNMDAFVKKITFQKLTEQGLKNISETVIEMARAEGLEAHASAVEIRLK